MANQIINYALTLGIFSGVAIATVPVFAQTTPLNLTITGGSFSVTNTSNGTTFNSGTVITPIGTAAISSATVTTFKNFNTGLSIQNGVVVTPPNGPDAVGNNLNIKGTASGNIEFITGNQQIFRNGGYNIDGNIRSITFNPSVGTPTSSTSVVTITGGSVQLDTSLSSSSVVNPGDVFVPITGGSFAVSGSKDAQGSTTAIRNDGTTLITPYGTVNVTRFDYNTELGQNVTAINTNRDPNTGDAVVVGDILQVIGFLTGSTALNNGRSANLNSTPTLIEGKVTSFQSSSTTDSLRANVTGGEIFVPASSITNGSSGNNGSSTISNNSNTQQPYFLIVNQFAVNRNEIIDAGTKIFRFPSAIESQSGAKVESNTQRLRATNRENQVSSYRIPMSDRILGIMRQ